MTSRHSSLAQLFEASAAKFHQHEAIRVGGASVSYGLLARCASAWARRIESATQGEGRVAVYSDKSLGSYIAVLASLYAGSTYVPLSPVYPASRNLAILEASKARVFIYQASGSTALREILAALPPQVKAIEINIAEQGTDDGAQPLRGLDGAVHARQPAYIMFTSGSTGKPKGVPISHANVLHYLDVISAEFEFRPQDRFTQNFELTFDLSIFDLFVPWRHGAAVCVPSSLDSARPAQYLQRHGITVWFSVPSAIQVLQQNGGLTPKSFPTLRLSLFCGEALTWDGARTWASAAPGSDIVNLYGPTELTVSCFVHRLPSSMPAGAQARSIVPIGAVHAGHEFLIADEQGRPVPQGTEGELCIEGPQRFDGYLDLPEKSEAVHWLRAGPDGRLRLYYRTGDLVAEDDTGTVHYIGRLDHQVKVNGYRVELEEIERAIRHLPGGLNAVVRYTRNPAEPGERRKLVAFITGVPRDDGEVLRELRRTLPHYMLPDVLVWAGDYFPLNGNGKVDINSLMSTLP